ncbi:MAG: HD-GYP domain-containing protein [Myxococcota bacterium]
MAVVRDEDIHNACVLIVDDQAYNITLLRMILRDSGYTNILATTDSREALPMYVKHRPDLVLLDLQMPHIDGFGVMDQLREVERNSVVPILVLTAELDPEVRYKALQSGARDFLNKPFDRIETVVRIRNLIEVQLLHKHIVRQNEILESKVRDRTQELRDTQMEIIHRLGHAAEYKDNETGNHIIRMGLLCGVLGEAVGMAPQACDMLRHASPMHDVGKIGIPDRVLLKPGKLEPDEWEVMKTHAAIGADLLSGSKSPLVQMAATIALTHHERWDGTGYPYRLHGEGIPLVGRIAAVCDVFDALTSDRPYKRAWTVEESLEEIHRGAGTHFDPALVTLFDANIAEILAIRAQYHED